MLTLQDNTKQLCFETSNIVSDLAYAYRNLVDIHNGSEAMNAYTKEQEQTRRDLLAYCKLDTLAMVKALAKLRKVSDV